MFFIALGRERKWNLERHRWEDKTRYELCQGVERRRTTCSNYCIPAVNTASALLNYAATVTLNHCISKQL